jgi:hypothetical protein
VRANRQALGSTPTAGLEIPKSTGRLSAKSHTHAAAPLTLTRRGVRSALTTGMVRQHASTTDPITTNTKAQEYSSEGEEENYTRTNLLEDETLERGALLQPFPISPPSRRQSRATQSCLHLLEWAWTRFWGSRPFTKVCSTTQLLHKKSLIHFEESSNSLRRR